MNPIEEVSKLLTQLPGIGPKSALRITYHLLHKDPLYLKNLGTSLIELRDKVRHCPKCRRYTDGSLCSVCSDNHRERTILCLVEQSLDSDNLEKTRSYKGLYFVLHGLFSPLDSIGPEELGFDALKSLVEKEKIEEIIIALSPTMEGNSTALYVQKHLEEFNIKFSRLALGIPLGGDIEYIDQRTLALSLEARIPFH